MSKRKRIEWIATEATKELVERGKLIEAGFAALAHLSIPKDVPAAQLRDMRIAYLAGAEHVWSSVMSIMDPGEEPTDKDMARMALIQNEIDGIRAELSEYVTPAQGRG